MDLRRVIYLFSLSSVAFGLVWLIFNYQHVVDQVVVANFQPSGQINQVVQEIKFTDRGRFMFLAAQPELSDRDTFNKYCEKKVEKTVVLGCYLGPQHIYIYNITDPRVAGVRQVTAAHEMLHVAYDRLSYSEKKRIDKLVQSALLTVEKAEPSLAERLKAYDQAEPGERNNELHSILGTESVTLPAELEKYYEQYFTSRSIITTYAAQYDKVFEDIKRQQKQLVVDLDNLANEINQLTQQYNSQIQQLNNDVETFNRRADSRDGFASQAQFDSARSELLARRDNLEAKSILIQKKVDEYETKRSQLNLTNSRLVELNSQIDSASLPSL